MDFLRAAVIQDAPVLFDKKNTVAKTVRLMAEAAAGGAQLALFPEAFIPAYPRGFSFGMVVGSRSEAGRRLWQRYWENSIDVPGPETALLAATAGDLQLFTAVGVIEREGGTLYCSILYFGADGRLLGKHRKLKPTGAERLIWGEGDGSTLTVLDTAQGKIGGLICWENYMPAARMALYGKGVQIYLAPTADARDSWQSTMQHIALEGRAFVLSSNQFVTKAMHPPDLPSLTELDSQPEIMCRGGSVILSPLGEVLAGPLYDETGILYADLDMDLLKRSKLDFDVNGHYARPDIFQLHVDENPKNPTNFSA